MLPSGQKRGIHLEPPSVHQRLAAFLRSLPFWRRPLQSHRYTNDVRYALTLKTYTVLLMRFIRTPTYHIHPPNTPSWDNTPLANISSLPIPLYTSPVPQNPLAPAHVETSIPFIPAGGLTRRILSSLPPQWTVPTGSLLQFVTEGDNRSDASLMAAVVAKVLSLDSIIKEWKQPFSWQQGLFGTPQDQTLYG